MKGLLGKIRFSRKLLVIFGGFVVLSGGTGAAAVYVGADQLLGPSYAELNGLKCTEVRTVTIHRKDRFWIRKFITTEPTDGPTRLKTALRVASAVYDAKKPDLVQVVVLDKNGPTDRADMRGRAIGADVVYIPDPARVPEEAGGVVFSARYVDKPANEDGQFYGERIVLPLGDVEAMFSHLNDKTDCYNPVELAPADAHAAPASGHGETADGSNGHGGPEGHDEPAHGEPAHGEEVPVADGHGAEPVSGESAGSGGWLASIKGMVFGDEKAVADHGQGEVVEMPAEEEHGEASDAAAETHQAMVRQPIVVEEHEATEPVEDHVSAAPFEPKGLAGKDQAAEGNAVEDDKEGWLASLKGLVWGGSDDAQEAAKEPEASTPDIDEHAKDAASADDAGAAWLAKLKSKSAGDADTH